jgi:predicted phosphoribosyltransferase
MTIHTEAMEYLRMKEIRTVHLKCERKEKRSKSENEHIREAVRCVILVDDDALHFTQNECMLL